MNNKRVTVQGPVKEQQPDGMSHRGYLPPFQCIPGTPHPPSYTHPWLLPEARCPVSSAFHCASRPLQVCTGVAKSCKSPVQFQEALAVPGPSWCKATVKQVTVLNSAATAALAPWSLACLADGKIGGLGYGYEVEEGLFDCNTYLYTDCCVEDVAPSRPAGVRASRALRLHASRH